MKKNIIKYGLMMIVVIIWGRIIVHYFGFFQQSENSNLIEKEVSISQPFRDSIQEYELKLMYQDPFFGQKQPVTPVKSARKKKLPTQNPQPLSTHLPEVEYKGLIKNNQSKEKTGLLVIEGKSYLIKENFIYEELNVLKFEENTCQYKFNNKIYTVTK